MEKSVRENFDEAVDFYINDVDAVIPHRGISFIEKDSIGALSIKTVEASLSRETINKFYPDGATDEQLRLHIASQLERTINVVNTVAEFVCFCQTKVGKKYLEYIYYEIGARGY